MRHVPKIGEIVRVRFLVDPEAFDDPNDPGTLARVGQVGVCVGYLKDDIGATPTHPMAKIRFRDGDTDVFWPRELERVWPLEVERV